MPNTIVDVTGDMRIRMQNSRWARMPLSGIFTPTWTTIRVGVLCAPTTDPGANVTGTPRLALGFCSGTSAIPGDASATHFVGWMTTAASWLRTAGNLNTLAPQPTVQIGATLTHSGVNFAGSAITFGIASAVTPMLMLEITKGSPNYSFRSFEPTAAAATCTEATLFAQMQAATPVVTSHTYRTAQTMAVDEATNGVLDSICMYFSPSAPTWDVAAVCVFKLA